MYCFQIIIIKKVCLYFFSFYIFFIYNNYSFAQYILKSTELIADYEVEIGSPIGNSNPNARCFVYAFQKTSNDDIALFISSETNYNYLNQSVIICNDCISYDKSFQVNKLIGFSPDIYITPLSSLYHRSTSFYLVDKIQLADMILVVPPDLLVRFLANEILLFDLLLKNYNGGSKKPLEDYLQLSHLYDNGKVTGDLKGYKSKIFEGNITEISRDYIVLENKIILKATNTFSIDLEKGDTGYLYYNGFHWEVLSDSKDDYAVDVIYYPPVINFKDCVSSYFEVVNNKKGLIKDMDSKVIYSVDISQSSLFLPTFMGGFGVILDDNKLIIEDLLNTYVINIQRTKKRK